MGRWGEEEKKTKGIFGCLFAISLLGMFSYLFYINYPNMEVRRILEAETSSLITRNYTKTAKELENLVIGLATQQGFTLESEAVEVTKEIDQYGNPKFELFIDFPMRFDLLVTEVEFTFPIWKTMTVVRF